MINRFWLRAKWTRAKRKGKSAGAVQAKLVPRPDDLPVSLQQYLLGHVHLARCWGRGTPDELAWFLASMRGELPPRLDPTKAFYVHHIFLPLQSYLRALEALTTRLGVRLPT